MTFFFLGANGFVGRHAFALARSQGHAAWGTARQARVGDLLPFDLGVDRLLPVLRSIDDRARSPRYGIVCASIRQIDECARQPETTRMINVTGTIAALRDLAEHGYTPVFLSSSYVFNGDRGYYTEEDAVEPCCEYGRHKAEVECWLAANLPDSLVLRLDKIVSPESADEQLFGEWLGRIRRGQALECIGGQIISPTNVHDIAAGILEACLRNLRGVYHVSNGEFFTRDELATQFSRAIGVPANVVVRPQEAFKFADQRPLKTYLDSRKFIKATDFRFSTMRETWSAIRLAR